jgi:hypothetical protein
MRPIAFHPLLVAAFPALFVCSQNIEQFSAGVLLTAVPALVGLCAVAWAVAGLATRDARKGALIASLFFLLAFSYTAARRALPPFTWELGGWTVGPRKLTFAVWTLAFVAGTWFAARTRRDLGNLTRVLNVATLALVILPTLNIAWYEARHRGSAPATAEAADDEGGAPLAVESPPDIYWIIMDAYGREDVLRDLYGLDNRSFTGWLREKGFIVGDRSTSNYPSTYLAVPSPLQMDYIESFVSPEDRESGTDLSLMARVVNDSRVVRFLRRRGYRIMAFSSGVATTEMKSADVYLTPGWFYDEFSNALVDMTPLGTVFRSADSDGNRRRRLLFMFDGLVELASRPGPKFVFAHFPAPHRPFVFGRSGEAVSPPTVNLPGHDMPMGDAEIAEYRRFYADEVVFLNAKLRAMIEAILAKSARPPVIVLQGDHGPMSMWGDPVRFGGAAVRERYPILNAYYLRGEADNALHPGITPVNSFRVAFNHVFGARFPMLSDRNFCPTDAPYRMAEVTATLRNGGQDNSTKGDAP